MNVIEFPIGIATDLAPLFAYRPVNESLNDSIEHTFNQTLLRDLFFGSWARVLTPTSTEPVYRLKITSPDPNADLTRYKTVVPSYLAAVRTASDAFNQSQAALAQQQQTMIAANPILTKAQLDYSFLPPFGLAMARTSSIQLLHYPPDETLTYMDYLYSPTNRRWESLLGFNVDSTTHKPYVAGHTTTLLETIVDIAPIAAPGGSNGANLIAPVLANFLPYAKQMLNALLRPTSSGKATQPVIAYGGPVMDWLYQNYKTDIDQQLAQPAWFANQTYQTNPALPQKPSTFANPLYVLALLSLPLLENGPPTPVLCANHPSRFFHNENPTPQETANNTYPIMALQDLVSAGWQAKMSQAPEGDPVKTLQAIFADWSSLSTDLQKEIFQAQVEEFSYADAPNNGTAG